MIILIYYQKNDLQKYLESLIYLYPKSYHKINNLLKILNDEKNTSFDVFNKIKDTKIECEKDFDIYRGDFNYVTRDYLNKYLDINESQGGKRKRKCKKTKQKSKKSRKFRKTKRYFKK